MSTLPRQDGDRRAVERLPFTDDPATCPKCGGALQVTQIVKKRHGKVVIGVGMMLSVCPRCRGGRRR